MNKHGHASSSKKPYYRSIRFWSTAAGLILLTAAAGCWLIYNHLRPSVHFAANKIPVLTQPVSQLSQKTAQARSSPVVPQFTREHQQPVDNSPSSVDMPSTSTSTSTSASIAVSAPASSGIEFNILLLGDDNRAKNGPSHTDSIMLVHINATKHLYNVLSIPRDTRVHLPGIGETKITHASFVGYEKGGQDQAISAIIQAVSNLTGIPINYYAETDYMGFQDIVNAVGGIEVNLPFPVKLTHPWYPEDYGKVLPQGINTINGKMAAEITHERYSLSNGDFDRQALQEIILKSIVKKALRPSEINKIPQIIQSSKKFLVCTNMSLDDMLSLALELKNSNMSDIHYYQVAGHADYEMDPLLNMQLYYFIPDQQQLKNTIAAHFKD